MNIVITSSHNYMLTKKQADNEPKQQPISKHVLQLMQTQLLQQTPKTNHKKTHNFNFLLHNFILLQPIFIYESFINFRSSSFFSFRDIIISIARLVVSSSNMYKNCLLLSPLSTTNKLENRLVKITLKPKK